MRIIIVRAFRGEGREGLGGRFALLLPPEVHSFWVAELIIYCTYIIENARMLLKK